MPPLTSGLLRALLLAVAVAPAGAQSSLYQVAVDQDQLHGAPDFSFLNSPLTAADRLFVRDGHLYRVGPDVQPNTADDQRVRLFGVNMVFGANFPAPQDAPRIAARLRRLGVNLVRLHHMDSQLSSSTSSPPGLLTGGPYPTFNQTAITRLRGFLDAFRAAGIYVDLNLHVGYQFRPSIDGVPEVSPMPDMSKPLQIFYPRMVDQQAQYTRDLLSKLALKDDPVLGVVEIDNENSLLFSFQTNWDDMDRYVVGEYRAELTRQWNQFLSAKYGTTEKLREAWGVSQPDGPQMLSNNWILEVHPPAQATYSVSNGEVTVQVTNGSNWVIVKNVGFSVAVGQPYLAEVEARADLAAGVTGTAYWTIMEDVSPWRGQTGQNIGITNQWQKFSMAVFPTFDMNGTGRFHLGVEGVDATVHFRNWSLKRAGLRGLDATESLEQANVRTVTRADIATTARANDNLLFLADRDRHYLSVMLAAVREGAGPLVPVTGTQMGFGGLLNLDSQQDMDYQDDHFYVDHYEFPHTAWDSTDWLIHDRSSTGEDLRDILEVAILREAGKPYTVSEFNQPWPNTHAAEIDPVLAAFGAFQDWDAVMHFDYSGSSTDWDRGRPSGFDLNGDMTKLPGFGQAAFLFRSGVLASGAEPLDIPVTLEDRLAAGRDRRLWDTNGFLASVHGFAPATIFQHPVRLVKDSTAPLPAEAQAPGASPYHADTGELSFDAGSHVFLIHAPRAAGAIGFVTRSTAGALDVDMGPSARGFASIVLTAMDGKPIPTSGSMLLSNPGYTLRKKAGWTHPADDIERLVNYPGVADTWTLEPDPMFGKPSGDLYGGSTPVWMERVDCYVTLRTTATSLTVYPLDGTGARLPALAADQVMPAEAGGFRIHLGADSPWYEIIASGFNTGSAVTNVSAASYQAGGALALESIVSGFGTALATGTDTASTLPLPTRLAGTQVFVRDAAGVERATGLFYASPLQLNWAMPVGTIPGLATVTVVAADGAKASQTVQVTRVAPGVFAFNSDWLAAAQVQRVPATGDQRFEAVAARDASGAFVPLPIDLGPGTDDAYLVLYGTGIRFRRSLDAVRVQVGGLDCPALYAGAQGMVGLDQVNVRLPRELAGRGDVEIALTVEGQPANTVHVRIK